MKQKLVSLSLTVFVCALAHPVQGQDDTALVTTFVPPNVMILLDNSGSMRHAIWHQDFDPYVFQDLGTSGTSCDIGTVSAISGSDGFCPGSGSPTGACPSSSSRSGGSQITCQEADFPASCASVQAGFACSTSAGQIQITLPEFTTGGTTSWSRNYLHWLVTQWMNSTGITVTLADRIDTARNAVLQLIDAVNPPGQPERVRFGLAQFSSGSDPDGGYIAEPIQDGNTAAVRTAVQNVTPGGWTPLAETLTDIGEYMTGDGSIANCSGSSTIAAGTPMDDFCRDSFVIILTDGEPTRDDFANMGLSNFTCAIGNADADDNENPTPATGRTDAPPYQSGGTDWLDDVAFSFFDRDLRTGLQGKQNIVTYTIGFSIDHPLLSDAAANGGGVYYTAQDASSLVSALVAAVQKIFEQSTSFTASTVPSSRTSYADGFYVAYFTPRSTNPFWDGHLEAFQIDSNLQVVDSTGAPAIDPTNGMIVGVPFWDTADRLLDPSHPPRQILTRKAGVQTGFTTATMDAADLNVVASDLGAYPNPANPGVAWPDVETLSDALVDYLYGQDRLDDDGDGDDLELRNYVLGDIFHSSPLVIGSPPFALASEEGFGLPGEGEFLDRYLHRERVIYFGANDGMFHAVHAGTYSIATDSYDQGSGDERFAYVPELVHQTLKYIPRNDPRSYYYVDGSPAAADVWFPSSNGDIDKDLTEWHTVAVTGLRQGGPGYFALDVTDPSGNYRSYPQLLWELDDPSEPMGESWSEPIITRIKLRGPVGFGDHCGADDGEGDCREQWVMIVGGGFLSEADPNLPAYIADPNDPSWSDDSKSIFVVAMDSGQVLARLAHDPADAQLQEMRYAIPSTPAVLDLDFDGFADVIYLGDTGGQLWKWDISSVGVDSDLDGLVDNWPYGIFFRSAPVSVPGGLHYRSIFYPLAAAYLGGDLVLAFATGERTELAYLGDATADDNNRFYKIRDPIPLGPGAIPSSPYGETNLTNITNLSGDNDTTDLGYYWVAPESSKFITNHLIFSGFVISTSYLPNDGSQGICYNQGEAFLHVFSLDTGAGFFAISSPGVSNLGRTLFAGVGVPSEPRITVEGGQSKLYVQTSSGAVFEASGPPPPSNTTPAVYWKQEF